MAYQEESNRAVALEAKLAEGHAGCADLQTAVQSEALELCQMQAEISRLQTLEKDKAKKADARLTEATKW